MDLDDKVRENVAAEEFDRRDKMGDFNAKPPDWMEVEQIIDGMSNSEFLQQISRALVE